MGYGIDIEDIGNSVTLINSSIYGGNNGVSEQAYIRVFATGTALLLNTTHGNSTNVESGGSLTIKWYLNIRVISRTGNPIENAHIIVNDTFDNNVFDGYTESNGYARWIVCTQRIIPGSSYTPHEITAFKDSRNETLTVNMIKSKEIWILFDDLTINLSKGWNLISIPTIHYNVNIDYVLSSISGDYDCAWCYDRATDTWYDSNNDFKYITHEIAIWIHMKEDAMLNVIEKRLPMSTDIQLYQGWNFIGFPSITDRPILESLNSIGEYYTAIQTYNGTDVNDPWKHYNKNKYPQLNDLNWMRTGKGYWLYVTENCTLTIAGF
ncbi:MAG: hypothetical protein JSV09_09335 [Thermoplasmata archaeon]|nr:MAG: hypothetical protein JSV09_09335 [Thermoplasmata archaeon]